MPFPSGSLLRTILFVVCLPGLTILKVTAEEAPPAAVVMDLNTAYQFTLQRNETLRISAEEIRAAEARYWQAVSAVLPQVNFLASERVRNSNNGGSGGSSFSSGNRRDSFQGQVMANWTVFQGFRDYNLAGAAKAETRGRAADLVRVRQLLYLDTGDVYLQCVGLEKDLEVLGNLVTSLEQRRTELIDRIAIGRSRKSELLAAETDIADTESEIASVKGLLGASRELLAFLTGVPSDRFTLAPPPGNIPRADRLYDYLWKSGARPDLQAAAEYETAAKRNVSAAIGSFWPKIDLGAGWLAIEDPETDQEWNVTITAEVPIFDGGLRASELAESKANLHISSLNLTRIRRVADYEVRLAYNNFISSSDQYLKLTAAETTAQENYQSQQRDYDLGRSSNLDVLVALTNWQELRRRLLATEIQARSNLIALEVAAGEPFPIQPPGTNRP